MIVCFLLLFAWAVAAQPQPKYALVETRELPGNHRDTAMFSGLYAARDGIVYIGSLACAPKGS